MKDRMNIVITGHVDHGKSTLVGRLLAETNSLPRGKLEDVKKTCEKNGKIFEYSMLLDALEDEQKQGITIDSARIFFKSETREYVIIDAPGHIEFLRNMLSGASRAAAAVLVIDAVEGIAENSKRHGLLLSLLGISQILVAVNKLDALSYDENIFRKIKAEYEEYLRSLNIKPAAFVPISARDGANIIKLSENTPWYQGETILDILDRLNNTPSSENLFFAMPLQDIYRFSDDNDDRRIYAGSVISGKIKIGDRVKFLPSNKEARIKTIETWGAPPKTSAKSNEAIGVTLDEDIYLRSGELMVKADERSSVNIGSKIRANIIWLSEKPFTIGKDYLLKLGAEKVRARLEKIERVLGDNIFENTQELKRNECAGVVLSLSRNIAFCPFRENASLGRFAIVDGYDAAGGGIALDSFGGDLAGGKEGFEEELFALLRKYFPHRFTDFKQADDGYNI